MSDENISIGLDSSFNSRGTDAAQAALIKIGEEADRVTQKVSELQQTMRDASLMAPMKAVIADFHTAVEQAAGDPIKLRDAWASAMAQLKNITGQDLVKNSMQSLLTASNPQEIMEAMENIGREYQRTARIVEDAEKQREMAARRAVAEAKAEEKEYTAIQRKMAAEAKKAAKEQEKAQKELADSTNGSVSQTRGAHSSLLSSFARVAKYRMLRAIIRAVTQAFKEGTENIYQYSVALGRADASHFADTMDSLASAFLYLKNAIGSVVAPLLSALVPALQTVISWVALALDYLAQFFAVINGQSTYSRAKKQATTWKEIGSAASGAAAAAQDYKNTILSFDEIHALNDPSSGGGGGGGGASSPNYSDMFEEVELGKNIFTSLGKLFSKDGVVGKALGFFTDIGTFVTEALSPALSYLWGTITGDIEMCEQAYRELQEAVSSNATIQKMLGKAAKVREWFRLAIDDIKLWFWNAVEDVTEFLRPLLELMGWDVDENTRKIDEQKEAIRKHQAQVISDTIYMNLWAQGYDADVANMVANTIGWSVQTALTTKDIVNSMGKVKTSTDNTKSSVNTTSGAWGAYSSAVYNAQNTSYTGSNVNGGLSGTAWYADNATSSIWNLQSALDALRRGASTAVNIAVNVLKNSGWANGGYVMANGGIIPRFDGGGINSAQLFMANENGNAELIGSIGNRTAVANQGQMVEAMAEGVYRAMSDVMSQGSNTEVNVYMNDEIVARAADRGNRLLNRRFNVSLA